ncbi:Protein of unknown function [Sinosporangium album]|uniref:DinB superfamily protein n=1 Tax=Sinosporangium album TaxID=504805 RepID=A0A1G8CNV0_9ACTN|nr:DinB family protein [Sinosporangium album]SDH47086.1 Protein of unknown function [Sinosporangium album]
MAALVPPIADEREGLLRFLAQQRHVARVAAHGLTEEQLRATPTAGALSVGGLIKHLAHTEQGWLDRVADRQRPAESDYHDEFVLGPDESFADVLDFYDRVAQETEEIIAGVADLGREVPVPQDAPWFPADIKAWSVRWVLLHLIEETARHAGHADMVREAIDGATAYPLLAAVEGWPATEWLTPWQPADS